MAVDERVTTTPAGARMRRVARAVAAVARWLGVVGAVCGLVLHELDTAWQPLVVAAAGAWLLAPWSVVALLLHLLRRGWRGVVVSTVVVAVQVGAYGPLFVAQDPPAAGTTVRVMTQNLLFGRADPAAVVQAVRGGRVDVLALQEVTPAAVAALGAAGLDVLMPHRWVRAEPGAQGLALYSRFPLTDADGHLDAGVLVGSAVAALPGGVGLTVVTAHPSAPFPAGAADWHAELPRLARVLHDVRGGPVVVGGDFNATWDHSRFRAVLRDGYRDAAEQAGAGVVRSWPANRWRPVIGIDHVLTRGAVATVLQTVATPGTDHRGVMVTVVVPT